MNAQEMFEKLDFYIDEGSCYTIGGNGFDYKSSKNDEYVTFDSKMYTTDAWIDKELHEAIQQQLRELEWIK